MQNPFVYGEVVPGEAFVDREVELDRLVEDLAGGQKVFLISPRRYGKSSLIRQALTTLARRGALTVEVTVSAYSSYVSFLEGYARALASFETRWQRGRDCSPRRSPRRSRRSGSSPRAAAPAASRWPFPWSAPSVTSPAWPTNCSPFPGVSRRSGSGRWWSPWTNSRQSTRSTAAASSMRCEPPRSTSATSVTCSPDR